MDVKSAKQRLASRLVDAITALIQAADSNDIPRELPHEEYEVAWYQDAGGGRSTGTRETRRRISPLRVRALLPLLSTLNHVSAAMQALGKTAHSIAAEGSFPVGTPTELQKPDHLTALLLTIYLEKVGTISLVQPTAADISQQFVDDLRSPDYVAVLTYRTTHFNAPRPFTLEPNVHFRPVSMRDIERFCSVRPVEWPGFHQGMMLSSTDWICEITNQAPKGSWDALNDRDQCLDKVRAALSLTTPGRCGFRLLAGELASPFFRLGTVSNSATDFSGRSGGNVLLQEVDIDAFNRNYNLASTIFEDSRFASLRLPLRRLLLAISRAEDEDRIVDYTIGLERLLAPDSEHLEVTFRFRLRGAALLPASFGRPSIRRKLMSDLYQLRSDIVHRSARDTRIAEMLPKAEQAFITIFLAFARALPDLNPKALVSELDNAMIKGAPQYLPEVTASTLCPQTPPRRVPT